MTSDSHLQPLVAAQFEALADVLVSIAPTDWDRPSLCEGWRIREVIAHLTMPARYDQDAFMAELRGIHLGAPAPRRSVLAELQGAFESAVKRQTIRPSGRN